MKNHDLEPKRLAVSGLKSGRKDSNRRVLWLVVAVCLAPVIASYLFYYIFKPVGGSANYGQLLEPQRPIPPSLMVHTENGAITPLQTLQGKWLLLAVDASACDETCAKKLYFMRQVRAAQGIERERVVTVWLRTDRTPVPSAVQRAYAETHFLSVDPAALVQWLPLDEGRQLADHIYLVDPNGNLMMRFPAQPDPGKIKKDLSKLLKWSGIG